MTTSGSIRSSSSSSRTTRTPPPPAAAANRGYYINIYLSVGSRKVDAGLPTKSLFSLSPCPLDCTNCCWQKKIIPPPSSSSSRLSTVSHVLSISKSTGSFYQEMGKHKKEETNEPKVNRTTTTSALPSKQLDRHRLPIFFFTSLGKQQQQKNNNSALAFESAAQTNDFIIRAGWIRVTKGRAILINGHKKEARTFGPAFWPLPPCLD